MKTLFLSVPTVNLWDTKLSSNTGELLRQARAELFSLQDIIDLGIAPSPLYHGLNGAADASYVISQHISSLHLKRAHLTLACEDESSILGALHGLLHHHPDMLLLWVCPHACATPPSRSICGLAKSMSLAWLLGVSEGAPWWLKRFLTPRQLVYLGTSVLTEYEQTLVAELDISLFPAHPSEATHPLYSLAQEVQVRDPQKKRPVTLVYHPGILDPDAQNRLQEILTERNYVASILTGHDHASWAEALAFVPARSEIPTEKSKGSVWSELRSLF